MSAIAGLCFPDGRPVARETLDRMIAAAPVRGFDGATAWNEGPAGLIRFAHATTPEAIGEVQPFRHAESGTTLLLDGRLDNRADLLALVQTVAPNAPDGEIALALYLRFGREFVLRLVGDFAIAVWEPRDRRMSLFRSPIGFRPLMWSYQQGAFAFATDARTLIVGLGLERRLNEGAFGEYLAARFVSETDTYWQGIERVPQGGAVILENGSTRIWPWHGGPFEDYFNRSMEDHVERFNELFDSALTAANRANGPVTSHLSGGLDSSSVVCRSTEMFRAGRIEHQIGAISARFPGAPHDETPFSSSVEEHLGITAEVVTGQPFRLDAAQAWVSSSYQMPLRPNVLDTMGGTSAALKANGRRVLLTGEGGDDWLNGTFGHWPDLLRSGRLIALFRHGAKQWPGARPDVIARRTLYPALMPLISRKHRQALLQPHVDFRLRGVDWLRPEWAEKIGLQERWHHAIARPGLANYAQRSRYAVFSNGGRYTVAEPAFAFAESRGLEVRHPFHDARLTRFYMGISDEHLRTAQYRKLMLREAMRGTLPEMVRTRKTKAYFVTHTLDTTTELFRQRPAHELLPAKLGWIDPDKIVALYNPFAKWCAGGQTGPMPSSSLGPVWFAIAADMWLRHAFEL